MIKIDVFNIDTLAAKAKVSRRTIHYYLQRGLLMPPEGDGRGSHYTEDHLSRLKEIQRLSSQGVPLTKMKTYFECGENSPAPGCYPQTEKPSTDSPEKWERYTISEGIELHIRNNALPADRSRAFFEFIAAEVHKRPFPLQKVEKQ